MLDDLLLSAERIAIKVITSAVSFSTGIFHMDSCYTNISDSKEKALVAVEAGEKGWNLIEKKELTASLVEFLSISQVVQVVIRPQQSYFDQVKSQLDNSLISHWVLDFRSTSASFLSSLFQAARLLRLFQSKKVCPLVFISDLPVFRWRLFAAIVSRNGGVIWTLMAPVFSQRAVGGDLPFLGPQLMPFSLKGAEILNSFFGEDSKQKPIADGGFFGLLYEPRVSELSRIQTEFELAGLSFVINGRNPGISRLPDLHYWSELRKYRILVTTSCQVAPRFGKKNWPPHLIFRYTEALLVGQFLLAPFVSGMEKYFIPFEHFVPYDNPRDAALKASYYLDRPSDLDSIAAAGRERILQLIKKQVFWNEVNDKLIQVKLPPLK